MPPTDASTDAGTAPVSDLGTDPGPGPGTDNEDTLDLRLPDELLALLGSEVESAGERTCSTASVAGARSPLPWAPSTWSPSEWSVISRSSPAG